MRVLGFLSPIDLFRGKIPDLEKKLLPLDELTLGSLRLLIPIFWLTNSLSPLRASGCLALAMSILRTKAYL
jgi:hypothetical protein